MIKRFLYNYKRRFRVSLSLGWGEDRTKYYDNLTKEEQEEKYSECNWIAKSKLDEYGCTGCGKGEKSFFQVLKETLK